ncbi:MAG: TatD family hydrolase [Actinomycetota bacterium]|nr:TatD family hydrolase [Actinomycetota bacterium]
MARELGWPDAPDALGRPVIDSHTHLDVRDRSLHGDQAPDADALLAWAEQVGVPKVVQIGCDVESAEWSVLFAREPPTVAVGVGVHPNDAARIGVRQGRDALEAAWARIDDLARDPVVCAVGETGLDYFRTPESEGQAIQHESFRWHIDLARELDKTLVIHDRDSHDDVISVLLDQGAPKRVVFHCFSGDVDMARVCAKHGWFMSFAGVITFGSAEGLREALRTVPDDLLLVETDAPYLTPKPNRGRVNATYLMPWTVRRMAEERGVDVERLCDDIVANTHRAFGHW